MHSFVSAAGVWSATMIYATMVYTEPGTVDTRFQVPETLSDPAIHLAVKKQNATRFETVSCSLKTRTNFLTLLEKISFFINALFHSNIISRSNPFYGALPLHLFTLARAEPLRQRIKMHKMPTSDPCKTRVGDTGSSDSKNRNERRVFELVGSREDHGGSIGNEFKSVLPGRFDGGECAAIFGFHFLCRESELACSELEIAEIGRMS